MSPLVAKLVTSPPLRKQYLILNENTESKQCHAWDVEEHNTLCLELYIIKMNWESMKCNNILAMAKYRIYI